ncbi:hypothetical protein BGX31_007627 [Mortierella sp. GBA43]|nr:hypothetical protein BGX31_007627 [Mortierella sp. GBA43]
MTLSHRVAYDAQGNEDPDLESNGIGQSKPPPRTLISNDHSIASTPLSRLALARPSKRRQESDLTADIEATVMALDIDKDSAKGELMEDATMDHGDHHHHPQQQHTDKRKAREATYSLVQNRMFDIPEIIRCIAEFLDKPTLAACCRVSKMWATHCTPLLWKHVVDKYWRDGRFYSSFVSCAHYVRTIKCEDKTDYEELLLCNLPRLRTISFHGSREQMPVKEKILTKVSSTLTSLVLSSVTTRLSTSTTTVIRRLKQLTTLKLLNVNLLHQDLARILRDCQSLEFLSLSRVQLVWDSDDVDIGAAVGAANPGGAAVGGGAGAVAAAAAAAVATIGVGTDDDDDDGLANGTSQDVDETVITSIRSTVMKIRYLALKEISIPMTYLSAIIRNCPDLLELSLARNEFLKITTDLIQTMKTYCPRLYALDVGSCKQIEHDTFNALFTSLPQITVINLSGTKIADDELLVLADNCKGLSRLDIQYCTQISSNGLHQFLSRCSPSLRHLEASGVTIEPTTFDRHPWSCTNLQILFVHIGLVGSSVPSGGLSAAAISNSNNNNNNINNSSSSSSDSVIESAEQTSQPSEQAGETSSSSTTVAVESVGNDKKRTQDAIHTSGILPGESSNGSGSTSSTSLSQASEPLNQPERDHDGDIVMQHPLHPIQEVNHVQYLGLMGSGAKLTYKTLNPLIHGFRSVKRLHVLGLYQVFKKEDLEWLMRALPELCRIDAEKYNISDDLLKWFEETYPHVQVSRQE